MSFNSLCWVHGPEGINKDYWETCLSIPFVGFTAVRSETKIPCCLLSIPFVGFIPLFWQAGLGDKLLSIPFVGFKSFLKVVYSHKLKAFNSLCWVRNRAAENREGGATFQFPLLGSSIFQHLITSNKKAFNSLCWVLKRIKKDISPHLFLSIPFVGFSHQHALHDDRHIHCFQFPLLGSIRRVKPLF